MSQSLHVLRRWVATIGFLTALGIDGAHAESGCWGPGPGNWSAVLSKKSNGDLRVKVTNHTSRRMNVEVCFEGKASCFEWGVGAGTERDFDRWPEGAHDITVTVHGSDIYYNDFVCEKPEYASTAQL